MDRDRMFAAALKINAPGQPNTCTIYYGEEDARSDGHQYNDADPAERRDMLIMAEAYFREVVRELHERKGKR